MLSTGEINKLKRDIELQDDRLVFVLNSLGDRTRFKLFKLLMEGYEVCVTEVATILDISVPAASQHFKVFEMTGLVDKDRMGQKICYQLKRSDPVVESLVTLINSHSKARGIKRWLTKR